MSQFRNRLRSLARRRPSRIRLRLTLLYGGLFAVLGVALLVITYVLVSNAPTEQYISTSAARVPIPEGGEAPAPSASEMPGPEALPPGRLPDALEHQRADWMHSLLVRSAVALSIMVVLSLVLGWLLAGRILRPIRSMTSVIQRISASNVHERLASTGPRDEIRDLSDTVDGLLMRLETALQAHKRFVANAAHEMRTPLTLEHALLEETLIDQEAGLEAYRATFQQVLQISRQQGQLLESLLTLAGSERGLDRRDPVDLAQVCEQVLATYRSGFERRGLEVRADIAPAATTGHAGLLECLAVNLVDNAMSYNQPGGWVSVATSSAPADQGHTESADSAISTGTVGAAGRAVLRVANSGPPVPADQVDRLFEPFHRLNRSDTGQGGHHGLGLSIISAIVSAHGGRVRAEARPEGGLLVEVSLEAANPPAAQPRAAPGQRAPAGA
ncbi:sensor protein CutS [Kineosporia sp. NBRC 101677]|uniref:sensor histidine kinase n=1 Tax=Kineosporia sp. NBRC 101677 TaxID=3032197 RepID=UPI0024A2F25B|nr:HAMP domain-containing sensor histidine kinase [Kineosporia sp. NBRC 101677]GLY15830.1 sensor protein CutS [Kineosporia sp. NBRC 101677]